VAGRLSKILKGTKVSANVAQIHLWPWSIGIENESVNIFGNENIEFPFYGSPILSFSAGISFYLDHRYEGFALFGSPYKSEDENHRVCESPNMDLVSSELGYKGGFNGQLRLHISENESCIALFHPQGVRARFNSRDDGSESLLCRAVVAWAQFFDDILGESKKQGERSNELSWSFVYGEIEKFGKQGKQPQMALIVKIAESLYQQLPITVSSARRVLKRKREMVSVDRLAEMDTDCIRWQARQPGKDLEEKAGLNNQALLGIARRESFNTLENRVLKDFIGRCKEEAKRYIKNEVEGDAALIGSRRHKIVRNFKNRCDDLYKDQKFTDVKKPSSRIHSNYVLQSDLRYRKVWINYLKILRNENEKDQVWDWQSRTWADIARLLVNVGLFELTEETIERINIKEIYSSTIHINQEQHLGSRVVPGSEPGPFFIWKSGEEKNKGHILEVVHPAIMEEHPSTSNLGRMGGHLYLVLSPISGGRKTIVVVWATHLAAAKDKPLWSEIAGSAKNAIDNHIEVLEEGSDVPKFKGLIIASDFEMEEPALNEIDNIFLVQTHVDQRFWINTIEYLKMHFVERYLEIFSE
jgi:hypothetical protein